MTRTISTSRTTPTATPTPTAVAVDKPSDVIASAFTDTSENVKKCYILSYVNIFAGFNKQNAHKMVVVVDFSPKKFPFRLYS